MTNEIIQEETEILENNQENLGEVKKEKSFEPSFTIREMLEAGVHFGHRTARWNSKMAPYIYGTKNELHIIDLTQSAILFAEASKILGEIVKRHGKILFVCTKKQGSESVKEVASSCGQYYVINKWLGGMLTNWKTISKSIKILKDTELELADEKSDLTKKEKLMLTRKKDKLENQLGGIREMSKLPDLIFVIDTLRESLAIAEAKTLNIPVMAIVDTNSNPDLINYPIPGNDDSIKAIKLYMGVIEESLKHALNNLPARKENFREDRGDTKKFQSKKPSKSINKFTKDDKSAFVKREVKTPLVVKEVKAPLVMEEVKAPLVKVEEKTAE